ncbi:phosphate transport system regulator PhoU [Entomoplasma ellychniae]|uniref:Phosphate transport system regulator PhoU n=2 Tax=Entomoplasma ellychniae TaxID=2114 RepID=A0A8E2QYP7_9MOLU|nr:phosphate transport system regulator PhoU [Entomoplasma ellychniae]
MVINMPTNKILDKDMLQIKDMLEKMINETKIQYAETFEILNFGDESKAMMIVEHDKIINNMLNEFTSTALWKIAKQQLVAKDLRMAVGGILLAREIEIIANYAKKLCIFFNKYKPSKAHATSIMTMFQLVVDMLDAFSDFFINYNSDQVIKVMEIEKKINEEFSEAYKHLISVLKKAKTKEETSEISAAILQLKNLERAGDHLLTVQEIVSFMRIGKFEETNDLFESMLLFTNSTIS